MRRNVYYHYNQLTDTYERAYPSMRKRMWTMLRQTMYGLMIGVATFLLLFYFVDFPHDAELEKENRQLKQQAEALNGRVDYAMAVMQDIADRDNNFYRVVMQAEPMSAAKRYAGIETMPFAQNYDSLSNSDLMHRVSKKVDVLNYQLYSQIKSFDELRDLAIKQTDRLSHIPAIQPVAESDLRHMASGYGYRRDPIYRNTKFHAGMDFSAPIGTPVYASGDGVVTFAGWKSGYGNVIDVDHGYDYVTRYAHLSKMGVVPGQKVTRGEQIGDVGNSGKSTGPHLHYEVLLKGQPQNPVDYYFYDLTPEQYEEMVREADNAGHVMD